MLMRGEEEREGRTLNRNTPKFDLTLYTFLMHWVRDSCLILHNQVGGTMCKNI